MSSMQGPLSGVRVLDLSRILAAPWAGQILADLGAEVIKVERPGAGDDTRSWGPPFLKDAQGQDTREAGYYLAVNRGKRSITVSLEKPEGQKIVRELAARSDIVLENYKAGTLARYGLDEAALRNVNPRLIYCSVTGFGQTGPRRDQPAYDFLIQAMGGLMSVTGEKDGRPGGGPQKVGVPIVDLMTGMYAAVSVLAALAQRERTGTGSSIDIAMLDVQVATLANQAMNYLVSGKVPRRNGNAHPNIQPQDVYACADGEVILVVGNDGQFARLTSVLGIPELAADARFSTNPSRLQHRDEMVAALEARLAGDGTAAWEERLLAAGVPAGRVRTVAEAIELADALGLDPLCHSGEGDLPQVRHPVGYSRTTVVPPAPPPLLGEHDDDVRSWLSSPDPNTHAMTREVLR